MIKRQPVLGAYSISKDNTWSNEKKHVEPHMINLQYENNHTRTFFLQIKSNELDI